MLIELPESGFLRLHQIIGNPKASPPILPIIPVGRSTWWTGVKSGRFPKAIKLSPGVTVWRVEDIRSYIQVHYDDSASSQTLEYSPSDTKNIYDCNSKP